MVRYRGGARTRGLHDCTNESRLVSLKRGTDTRHGASGGVSKCGPEESLRASADQLYPGFGRNCGELDRILPGWEDTFGKRCPNPDEIGPALLNFATSIEFGRMQPRLDRVWPGFDQLRGHIEYFRQRVAWNRPANIGHKPGA